MWHLRMTENREIRQELKRVDWQLFGVYVCKLNGTRRAGVFGTFGSELGVAVRFGLPALTQGQRGKLFSGCAAAMLQFFV